MAENVYDILKERGYLAQCTDEEAVRELLGKEKVTFYIGFDPTADSLHVGHYLALMVMSHLQKAGHRPICLVGGGTGTVGDPSGRTDLRKVLTDEIIEYNCQCFKKQMSRFIDFSEDKALLVNNGDWLRKLNYIDLLRDVGAHFSVNRMLAAECYKERWERGLTFLEFNYMVMQAYDFYTLYKKYGNKIQLGGDDQWSNIIAGVELIRRKGAGEAYGLTLQLLTKSDGKKMGKTAAGALWLDPDKTSPYDFYQYWRNIDDGDVEKCLARLTFLPLDEVRRLGALPGEKRNEAKKVLAFEVTKLVHGADEAKKAEQAANALFGGGGEANSMPTVKVKKSDLGERLLAILASGGVFASKGEARRHIEQGGVTLNDEKVDSLERVLEEKDFASGKAIIRKGKKKYYRLELES